MTIGLDVQRDAIRAWAGGTLEEFLQSFDSDQAAEIRRIATPGLAVPNHRGATVTRTKDTEPIPEEPEATTWLGHKEWILNGPHALPAAAVASIGDTTGEISRLIDNSEEDRLYGLVVGYVQSGKTANYTALLARAADMGYTFVVVLSGVLNDLRFQTQKRLMRDLTGDPHGRLNGECIDTTTGMKEWLLITGLENDIGKPVSEKLPDFLEAQDTDGAILLSVMKKNVLVLEHLIDGLRRTDDEILSRHKLLIIDDEADHATVNTGGDGSEHADPSFEHDDDEDGSDDPLGETDPSRTNKAIRRIIRFFERTTYIGYTATPYANVLIDKDQVDDKHGKSLYPRDFIISLPRPDGYFGPDTFFGNTDDHEAGGRYTTTVPPEEVDEAMAMQEDVDVTRRDAVPDSLQDAMMDFVLSGIARKIRRSRGVRMNQHHTMLIHIQWRNDDQEVARTLVQDLFDEWKLLAESTIGTSGRNFRERLRRRWDSEYRTWDASIETWSQIEDELMTPGEEGGWMGEVEIRMINSLTDENLDYSRHPEGLNVIAIGGNKLSRGLTLEGLTVSYFLRRTKMYDSLMQMGRWFGYRHGYEDLVRVHSSDELLSWFEWLVRVEDSVRSDIARYDMLGLTPEQLSVRIPLHSTMKVSASSKMKNAMTSVANYSGITAQSVKLPIDNEARLSANLDSTTQFLEGLGEGAPAGRRMWSWRGVGVPEVADYLESLDIDGPPNAVFDTKGIARYMRRVHADEGVFVAHSGGEVLELRQGPQRIPANDPQWSFGTRYIARSQGAEVLAGETRGTGNIQLIGYNERRDMELAMQLSNVEKGKSGVCMIVYLIAPGSKPSNENRAELPDHETPIVGLVLRFPARDFEDQVQLYAHARGVIADV